MSLEGDLRPEVAGLIMGYTVTEWYPWRLYPRWNSPCQTVPVECLWNDLVFEFYRLTCMEQCIDQSISSSLEA